MSRLVLLLGTLLLWACLVVGALYAITPLGVQMIDDSTEHELAADARVVAEEVAALEAQMLNRTTDAAVALSLGAALNRLEPPPANVGTKKKTAAPVELLTPEQAITLVTGLKEQLNAALQVQAGGSVVLFNRHGQVVLAIGDAMALGADARNFPLVQDALYGLARLGVESFAGKNPLLVAITPILGADGGASGALLVSRAIDDEFCATLATRAEVPHLALGDSCHTGLLSGKVIPDGSSIVTQELPHSPLFVDPKHVGVAVNKGRYSVPLLSALVAVGVDNRPAFTALAARQQQVALVIVGCLVPVLLLLFLAGLLATRPANAIAKHLALIHQGSTVAPLQERRFSGGFKRVVKNLNTLLERQQARTPAELQAISQRLQAQPNLQQEEPELRFESSMPPLGPSHQNDERTVQKKVDPAQLAALREINNKPLNNTTVGVSPAPAKAAARNAAPVQEEDRAAEPTIGAPPPLAWSDVKTATVPSMSSGSSARSENEADFGLSGSNFGGAPPSETPRSENKTSVGPALIMSFSIDPDEMHFREVFQQFLRIRAECNEPVDNLSYEKFAEKLKKSREQVMQKQSTRAVRFEVYVKDGKAALKAVAAK